MRSTDGHAVEGAARSQIVQQLLGVLDQAVVSLSRWTMPRLVPRRHRLRLPIASTSFTTRNFGLCLNSAYSDSRRALEQRDYSLALITSCGILEAIVTDALEHKGLSALVASGAPAEKISDWSFETRLTVAEKAGLIRSGCARLPSAARAYRDNAGAGEAIGVKTEVTEREARTPGRCFTS